MSDFARHMRMVQHLRPRPGQADLALSPIVQSAAFRLETQTNQAPSNAYKPGALPSLQQYGDPGATAASCVAYRASSRSDKIHTLLSICRDKLKLKRADAVATVALQAIETKYDSWLLAKDFVQGSLIDSELHNECECIVTVGWEGGSGVGWASWNNEEVKAYLLQKGYVNDPCPPGSACAMKWSDGFLTLPPSKRVISFFADVVAKRFDTLLVNFSVGGSQIWGNNMLHPKSAMIGAPASWEDIWNLFTGGAERNLFWTHQFNINPPSGYRPLSLNPSDSEGIFFLEKQTGVAVGANGKTKNQNYWYGEAEFSQYKGGWKAMHAEVVGIANTMSQNWPA